MGTGYSKENKNYIKITSPFVCNYFLEIKHNYNREEYFKFVPTKKMNILQYDNCQMLIKIHGIEIQEIISFDVSNYKLKTDKDGYFYELEINRNRFTILFRISSKGLKIKETVIKVYS